MNWFHPILILLATTLTVFLEAVVDFPRMWLGTQVDLLPSLMVYTSLNGGLGYVAFAAFTGGFMFDSLSANPLGVSVLPLFAIGFVIQRYRGLILRDQTYAQFILGLAASAAAPVLTLLILINIEMSPLLGWRSLWQWGIMSVLGGAAAPVWFRVLGRALEALSYQPLAETSFREDREIKRGRK